jgi:uncharacterized pyridoxamine 5'-phosphate oxidase family protein
MYLFTSGHTGKYRHFVEKMNRLHQLKNQYPVDINSILAVIYVNKQVSETD